MIVQNTPVERAKPIIIYWPFYHNDGKTNFQLQFCATTHNPVIMTSVNRTKKKDRTKEEIPYAKAVAVDNDVMGGVDHFDQRKERHHIRSVKWWHRIIYLLIDLAIIKSFILWK
ncbi:piggyBac transposable element-derived protein 4 [Trichonephila clavipes]|nr:piggyBac transposable element-derived protein 4 [Trichonephila clavipes]